MFLNAFFFWFLFYLQAVGEDDIGVHRPNVQMVNEGAFDPVWNLLQGSQLVFDLFANLRKYQIFYNFSKIITQIGDTTKKKTHNLKSTHLIKVGDLLQRDFLLFLDGMTHRSFNSLQQEVKRGWVLSTHQTKLSRLKHAKSNEAKNQLQVGLRRTILKRHGMSLRNTPDSSASTWPPT